MQNINAYFQGTTLPQELILAKEIKGQRANSLAACTTACKTSNNTALLQTEQCLHVKKKNSYNYV